MLFVLQEHNAGEYRNNIDNLSKIMKPIDFANSKQYGDIWTLDKNLEIE